MEMRELGRSGLRVSPICLGCNVFGWTVDEATSFSLLDAWVDSGSNFVDTADMYSTWVPGHVGGESETIIGKWLRKSGRRDRIVLATKLGKPMGPDRKGLRPDYMRQALEASLRRLQTDRIDLYQSHDDDPQTPLADTLGAFTEMLSSGQVRAIGASNFTAPRLVESLRTSESQGLARYESLQPLFNLMDREPYEAELQQVCVEHGLGVLNFYGLAAGFLTGKYRKPEDVVGRPRQGTISRYLNERGSRVLAALDAVAAEHDAKPGQVALAWQCMQPGITAPIASATSLAQLQELIAVTRLRLTGDDTARLEAASAWRG